MHVGSNQADSIWIDSWHVSHYQFGCLPRTNKFGNESTLDTTQGIQIQPAMGRSNRRDGSTRPGGTRTSLGYETKWLQHVHGAQWESRWKGKEYEVVLPNMVEVFQSYLATG